MIFQPASSIQVPFMQPQWPRGRYASGGGGGMAWSLLGHSKASGQFGGSTPGFDTTGADFIVVGAINNAGDGLGDSLGNTVGTPLNATGFTRLYAYRPTVTGPGHSVSMGGFFGHVGLVMAAFSGSNISPSDSNAQASGSGTTQQAGSVTPSASDALLIAVLGQYNNSGGAAINDDYALIDETDLEGENRLALAFKTLASPAAQNPTWTTSSASRLDAILASYKPV